MDALQALLFIFIVYTIGDVVATATKSIVPSLFVCSVIFLGGFWLGIPETLFKDSLLYNIGAVTITTLLVHMGSMLNLGQLIAQWKTVLIAAGGIIGIVILLLLVGSPIVGKETAIVAAPPISGGIIAGLQMAESAAAIGRNDLKLMATLLVVLQGFIGYPLASFCLRREANRILKLNAEGHTFQEDEVVEQRELKTILQLPPKYTSPNYFLAKAILIAFIATFVSSLLKRIDTGIFILNALVRIDKNVLALILGIIFAEIGFLEREPLNKGNSFGFLMAALMAVIYGGLAGASPTDILGILVPIVICLVLGTIGIGIMSIIVGKVLKIGPWMAFAIGSSALFGFPGTYVVSQEVARGVAKSEEEKELVLSQILPKMLVAGFVTVSIGSVVLAGILAPMLAPAM
ncbi:MAG: hypothetical protein MR285_03415 [Peptoniphilus sp.]|uniref:hypothetical protein n=1 Tax=Peptoniphilus sp. TaxID=1971214 RepID=UPI0025FC2290|nr:hypothetical protein [Peptoniphilus sp.]MCI5643143.1 hypothetical protein [Peptoniphilus sp.]MDD7352270.1 hypothetical protein [Peptoniphilaceae bacterium]MDY3902914.1 hypothetical protein [Peptoniphilus sp.]